MPGYDNKKDIDKINALFGIITYDALPVDEKNIYDTFIAKVNEKGFDNLVKENKEQHSILYSHTRLVGEYVHQLAQSGDKRILDNISLIESYKAQEKTLVDKNAELQKQYDEIQKKIEDAQKEYDKAKIKSDKSLKEINDIYKKVEEDVLKDAKEKLKFYRDRRAETKAALMDHDDYIYRAEIAINTNNEKMKTLSKKSKEYKELEKKNKEYKTTWDKYLVEHPQLMKDMTKYDELVDKYDAIVYDEKAFRKEVLEAHEEVDKKADKIRESIAPTQEFMSDKETEISKLSEKLIPLEKEMGVNQGQIYRCQKDASDLHNSNLNYAEEKAINEYKANELEAKKLKQFDLINRALKNTTPKLSDRAVGEGINIVDRVYQEYKQKYNWFERNILGLFSFTNAYKDYQKFNEVRQKFMDNSGIKRTEIDTYLDDNTLTGTLKEKCDAYGSEKIKKEDIIIEKDLSKNQSAELSTYLKELEATFRKNFIRIRGYNDFVETNIEIDNALKMLNSLGDLKRENPDSNDVQNTIDNISNTIKTSPFTTGTRKTTIEAEINNALLPKEERQDIELKLSVFEMQRYKQLKADIQEKEINDNLKVLERIDSTTARISIDLQENKANGVKRSEPVKEEKSEPVPEMNKNN